MRKRENVRIFGRARVWAALLSVTLFACLFAPVPPASALSEPHPSLFGLNTLLYDCSGCNYNKDFGVPYSLGAHWVHYTASSIHWYSNGTPDFTVLDDQVRRARNDGYGVLISLGGDPRACSIRGVTNPTQCPPRTASELATYKRFLAQVLYRYRSSVDYYESWLEPNRIGYWPSGPNPVQYAALLKNQYAVFQDTNTKYGLHLKLLVGGPNGFSDIPGPNSIAALPFIHKVLSALHGATAFDGVGVHAYRYPTRNSGPLGVNWGPTHPDYVYVNGSDASSAGAVWAQMTWPQTLVAYELEFQRAGYGTPPMWLTEFGWPGLAKPSSGRGYQKGVNENLYPTETTQANWLTEAYGDLLQLPFVQAAFWFNSRDYDPYVNSADPNFFYYFGLLQYNFTPKPAAQAFKRLALANPMR